MQFFVPWWRAREQNTNRDSDHAHVAESAGKYWCCSRWGEKEEANAAYKGQGEVADAVGDPSEYVKDRVGVCGEDVGKVRSVKHIFERRKDSDPDVRAILGRNKSVKSDVSKRSRMTNWRHDFPISNLA